MKIIGITGGIGSGKSTISDYFKKKGYPMHDSDAAVSEIYKKPNNSFLKLLHSCGLKNIIKNKKINKKIIANNFFVNKKIKNKIEKHIHKEVRLKREAFIKKNLNLKKNLIFLDIPLLLENNLENQFDIVLCIMSTRANRVKRIMKNKKFSKEILKKIFKNQTTDKERRLRSDIIITNNKSKKDFIFASEKALMSILK